MKENAISRAQSDKTVHSDLWFVICCNYAPGATDDNSVINTVTLRLINQEC